MSENSKIQWTDHTFNPWIGCTKVAPECKNCYAEELMDIRYHRASWGKGKARVRTSEANWKLPLKWNRNAVLKCDGCETSYPIGHQINARGGGCSCGGRTQLIRRRVFCASLSDWLDDEVPIEWLADLLWLICQCQNLDWLLLTKRPQNWRPRLKTVQKYLSGPGISLNEATLRVFVENWLINWKGVVYTAAPRNSNIWIGVSAGADQAAALEIPARIHFLSCEPMLHPLDTTHAARFDWKIFGGESGAHARPCRTDWIREGVIFCRDYKIAAFVKQLGTRAQDPTGEPLRLRDSHGGDMSEWPEDLRVREFPVVEEGR